MKITSSETTLEEIAAEIAEETPEIEFTGAIIGDVKPIAEETEEEETPQPQEEHTEDTEGEHIEEVEPIAPTARLTHIELLKALDVAEDVYDRAGLTMILLGDSAKGMKDRGNVFEYTDDIHVAIRKNDYHGYNKMVFDSYIPKEAEVFEDFIHYVTPEGANIYFEFVDQKENAYFNMPDKQLYIGREVALPNPFETYYQVMCGDSEE